MHVEVAPVKSQRLSQPTPQPTPQATSNQHHNQQATSVSSGYCLGHPQSGLGWGVREGARGHVRAVVGLVASVPPLVHAHVAALAGPVVAVPALVGLGTSVHPLMHTNLGRAGESRREQATQAGRGMRAKACNPDQRHTAIASGVGAKGWGGGAGGKGGCTHTCVFVLAVNGQ